MAKYRKKKGRRSGSKKLPVAVIVPMAIPVVEAGKALMSGQYDTARYIVSGVDGSGRFNAGRLIETYGPLAAGVVVHKVANRVGVNRMIPKWVPLSI